MIVRYLRFRPGDVNCPRFSDDSLNVFRSTDAIMDHVSASWSVDETLSVTESDRVTVQWSLITESLNDSCHPSGPHGYGSLLRYGSGGLAFHHNLYAHHNSRNPRVGDNLGVAFVNNVIYDWGAQAGYSGDAGEGTVRVNYVGNYAVAGPSTRASRLARIFHGGSAATEIYQSGNLIDSNRDGIRNGVDTGWEMFTGSYTRRTNPFDFPLIQTDDAATAYERVLEEAGASLVRDAVDTRVIADVINETGRIIDSQDEVGGWPVLESLPAPLDTDQDGMADFWEEMFGLDPNDPEDRNDDFTGDGYTNLEKYLHWLVGKKIELTPRQCR